MRVILDEGVPRILAEKLDGATLSAVPFPNRWKGMKNGTLLRHIEAEGYDVLITNDRNMPAQQDIRARRVAVVILPSNRLSEVLAMVEAIRTAVSASVPGKYSIIAPR